MKELDKLEIIILVAQYLKDKPFSGILCEINEEGEFIINKKR